MSPRNLALLVLGVVAVAFSAIFIRLTEAPPMTIALYRNAIAAALLLPFALARHREEIRALTRRQWGLAAMAGVLLAAHFATWIPSLDFTTVAASTVLVTTQPLWVATLSYLVFGERLRRGAVIGIAVALAGTAVVSGGDVSLSGRAAFGDLLAILGAILAAGYFVTGRALRRRMSLLAYVSICYSVCALVMIPVVAASGQPFIGVRAVDWGLLLLMALVPQILGHTVFNYLLGDVEATVVAIAVMGEPVGATLLALGFFGETPPWTAAAGGALILAGVYVAITAQARARRATLPAPVE
ncbi:MAG: EamA family transporter [Actinomycetota bacterium]